MGSGYSKDKNIDLYLFTNKQYYVAGEYVEGQVYLNARAPSSYSNICIKIFGEEYVYWSEGSGKNRRSYSNRYNSYNAHILLVNFHNKVDQGQYCFPFAFLLPSMLCGSFIYSQNCYIKYMLRVELVHPTQQKSSQIFQMFLNILEPPRVPIGALSITETTHSKCCGCCSDYGTTTISLSCSKNFVLNGQQVQISGLINHSKGKQPIKQHKISLQQKRIMISSGGRTRNPIDAVYPLMQSFQPINGGSQKQINFVATIPAQIMHYTAIGRVTARYFILHLETDYGCCANTAFARLHLILHSRTPMIVQKKQMPPPPNWYPKIYPKISCEAMVPYLYNPLPQIPFKNLPNQNTVIQYQQQPQQQMYPQMNYANQGYQMQQMQEQQQANNLISVPITQFLNYQPTYYNQDMFTDEQKQQQGYGGYQPYFAHETTEANLISKN